MEKMFKVVKVEKKEKMEKVGKVQKKENVEKVGDKATNFTELLADHLRWIRGKKKGYGCGGPYTLSDLDANTKFLKLLRDVSAKIPIVTYDSQPYKCTVMKCPNGLEKVDWTDYVCDPKIKPDDDPRFNWDDVRVVTKYQRPYIDGYVTIPTCKKLLQAKTSLFLDCYVPRGVVLEGFRESFPENYRLNQRPVVSDYLNFHVPQRTVLDISSGTPSNFVEGILEEFQDGLSHNYRVNRIPAVSDYLPLTWEDYEMDIKTHYQALFTHLSLTPLPLDQDHETWISKDLCQVTITSFDLLKANEFEEKVRALIAQM